MLINIDYFQIVAALQIVFTNGPNILDGASGPGGSSGYEKPQAVVRRSGSSANMALSGALSPFTRTPGPRISMRRAPYLRRH